MWFVRTIGHLPSIVNTTQLQLVILAEPSSPTQHPVISDGGLSIHHQVIFAVVIRRVIRGGHHGSRRWLKDIFVAVVYIYDRYIWECCFSSNLGRREIVVDRRPF